jgi:hypothetical protein
MSDKRTSPFSQSRRPVFPFGRPVVVPVPDKSAVAHVAESAKITEGVKADLAEFAGNDSSLIQYGVLNPIAFPGLGIPQNVITFVVPPGRVLVVDRVEWWCSEPYLYGNGQFGWRLAVDGNQIPFWASQFVDRFAPPVVRRTDYFQIALAPGLGSEPRFSPLYLQSNQELVVELIELDPGATSFTGQAWASAYVYGTLRKPKGVL